MYCVDGCIDRFLQTYTKIQNSGLLSKCDDINVIMVGDSVNVAEYFNYLKAIQKVNPQIFLSDFFGEMNTIKAIWEFCQTSEDTAILYLHSKGASRSSNENIKAWVNYMEYFLIERHAVCLQKLKNYDTAGVEFYEKPMKHYSGNFWWANSNYIKTLPNFEESLKSSIINDPRWHCEFWLLNSNCNPCNLHASNIDLYGAVYEESNYKT